MARSITWTMTMTMALGSALALGLAACDDDDPTGVNDDLFTVSPIESDAHIFALLHESNLGEITAGQVAMQKATDEEVRDFAQMMIDEHTALDQEGAALAAQLGVAPALPDNALPTLQAGELAMLQAAAAGAPVDRTYIQQQLFAHQRPLGLVDESIQRAQRAALRQMLQTEVRPHVAAHLAEAQQIRTRIGAP